MTLERVLRRGTRKMGLPIGETEIEKFKVYWKFLVEANKRVNLTTIVDEDEVAEKHFLDSLSGAVVFDAGSRQKLVDIGSGAGFPSLPIKIVFPDLRVTIVEANRKKIRFLEDLVAALDLKDVVLVWGRAEEVAREPSFRGSFVVCVARAVAELRVLVEYCLPFVRVGGIFIAYKGSRVVEEVTAASPALKVLGGTVETIRSWTLPVKGDQRSLVVIRKIGVTPPEYPRRAGIPAKRPL
ncbi:MAG: 16S rRNA (guanine(527)-N(7))-methyltransferase RsmG [Peptococcaceae bacterium]|nr:16S rRNA (guanine(527)-N(7))-methyltransferase RsmG [Peptococcaceae bacterium]